MQRERASRLAQLRGLRLVSTVEEDVVGLEEDVVGLKVPELPVGNSQLVAVRDPCEDLAHQLDELALVHPLLAFLVDLRHVFAEVAVTQLEHEVMVAEVEVDVE